MSLSRDLLLLSIFEKWNPIAMGCHPNDGRKDCPLCLEYYSHLCAGCPISRFTGQLVCYGTPYDQIFDAYDYDNIEAEVEFLIRLLPQEDQENLEDLHKAWVANHKRTS